MISGSALLLYSLKARAVSCDGRGTDEGIYSRELKEYGTLVEDDGRIGKEGR